ncbi:hypothetical protein GCM10009799_38870 [Nocardiopsis rhodophaea]|uniref:DUF5753 domain-containing protein n=1 Tax=Nocardiopsis rhodophaea TaxID=280238 RepID=A0ABN2TF77_9ACTN
MTREVSTFTAEVALTRPAGTELERHPALGGPFRLLLFDDRPAIAHMEHMSGNTVVTDAPEVKRISAVWAELQAWAYSPAQSVELIRKVRNGCDASGVAHIKLLG